MSGYEYGPGNNCWLCGADVSRVCWCHDEDADLSKTRGYNGICRCPSEPRNPTSIPPEQKPLE